MSRSFLKSSPSTLRTAAMSNIVRRWKSSLHHLGQRKQQQRFKSLGSQTGASSDGSVIDAVCSKSLLSSSLPLFSSTLRLLSSSNALRTLCLHNINQNFVEMQYAVRGPVVVRAAEIEKELAAGKKKPFSNVIRANIGDAQAMGQNPITFLRQMLSVCYNPALLENPDIPDDVKQHAIGFLEGCHGCSAGAYTDSPGVEVVRRQIANFIAERDCYESDFNNIVISDGASPAIKRILALMNSPIDCKPPGVLVPIPQYPLYTATLSEYGMKPIGYYLDEEKNWGLDVNEIECSLEKYRETLAPRAIVVINPGNPTGQVLTLKNIQDIIKFAQKEDLVVLADEVYQYNIYDCDSEFHSFKKVIMDMGEPYSELELVCFNSASKGFLGECGIRGGYMEVVNFCPEVYATLIKSITASLCSTTAGQIAISALVNPPKEGDPSYELYMCERNEVLENLAQKADLVYQAFNSFEGFSCNKVQGAMYAFPQFTIPPKAIEEAKKAKMQPDVFYVFELLNSTGACVVPGSGFMQKPGTYHFRTTILPPVDMLKEMLTRFQTFHKSFMQKYK